MRRQAGAHALGRRQRVEIAQRVGDDAGRVRRVEADQLVEHDRGQAAARQRIERDQRVADVADDRRAAGARIPAAPRRRRRGFPCRSGSGRSRRAFITPRIQVTNCDAGGTSSRRYDSSRCVCALTSPGITATSPSSTTSRAVGQHALPRRAERDDAAAIDGEPAVADRRLADRQNPGRVIADQLGMTRSCLPARLRAG